MLVPFRFANRVKKLRRKLKGKPDKKCSSPTAPPLPSPAPGVGGEPGLPSSPRFELLRLYERHPSLVDLEISVVNPILLKRHLAPLGDSPPSCPRRRAVEKASQLTTAYTRARLNKKGRILAPMLPAFPVALCRIVASYTWR